MKKNTSGLKPWVPGQSGNPLGRAKNWMTKDKFKSVASRLLEGKQSDLFAIASNPDTNTLEAIIASALIKGIEHGDISRLNHLLDRLVGKVKEEIDVSTNEEREKLEKLSLGELVIVAQNHLPPKKEG